jgi:hypothetical protein
MPGEDQPSMDIHGALVTFARRAMAWSVRRMRTAPAAAWRAERAAFLALNKYLRGGMPPGFSDEAPAAPHLPGLRHAMWGFWTMATLRLVLAQDSASEAACAEIARLLDVFADIAVDAGDADLATEASLLALELTSQRPTVTHRVARLLRHAEAGGDPLLLIQACLLAWHALDTGPDAAETLTPEHDALLERAAMLAAALPAPADVPVIAPYPVVALFRDIHRMVHDARGALSDAFPFLANRMIPAPASPRGFLRTLRAAGVLAIEQRRAIRRRETAFAGTDAPAGADWSHRIVRHRDVSGIVLSSASFKGRDADELRLTLMHELTHAWCQLGSTGAWLATGNEALARYRTGLLTLDVQSIGAGTFPPISRAARRLRSSDLTVLVFAWVCADLARKLTAVRTALLPWLEGVAVFAETAVDPRREPDAASPPIAAMHHLDPGPHGTWDMSRRVVRYGAAVTRLAPDRLRNYFLMRNRPYTVGYLAVRSIVSQWRDVCGEPLSNERALIVLTEASRYGIEPFLPHPQLRYPDFLRHLNEGLTRFREMCLGLSAAQIMAISRPGGELDGRARFLWQHQGPVELRFEDISEAETEAVFGQLYRAWNDVPIGPLLDGIAPPVLIAWATAQFQALRFPIGSPGLPTQANEAVRLRGDGTIVRVSAADALFWIAPSAGELWLLIPTAPATADHLELETVRYRLAPEAMILLRHEIERRRRPRMRVVTFADMVRREHGAGSLPPGRIYRGFCYGAWSDVRFAGDLRHLEAETGPLAAAWDDVRRQVGATWKIATLQEEEQEVAAAYPADPDEVATMIGDWLASRPAWTMDGAAASAAALQASVLAALRDARDNAMAAGAAAISGSAHAADAPGLIRRGLDHFTGDDPAASRDVINALLATGRARRARLVAPDAAGPIIRQLMRPRPRGWDVR